MALCCLRIFSFLFSWSKDMPITLGDTSITGLGVGGLPAGTVNATTLANTLDLTSKTITLPAANAAMTRLASGTISSSTSALDIDLSSYSYTCYKFFIRNISMASNTQIWITKLTASNTTAGSWYGGATRSGEGQTAQVQYGNQPHWYILGDTTTTTVDAATYHGSIDATLMLNGTSNKWSGVANAVIRNGTGQTQNINTGAINIQTTALWGWRFAGGANIATLSYAIYGVNMS
jgi:hypothetical protein